MKKITKILAIVMAIAILACPLASAAGTAVSGGTSNGLNIEVVNNDGAYAVKATIEAEDGFMLAVLKLDVAGIALDATAENSATVTDYSVIADAADANTDAAAEAYLADGVLTVYVEPKLDTAITEYAKVVVEVPVTVEDTYSVAATEILAASDADDINYAEHYVDFGFADVTTGAIDTEAAAEAGLVISVEGTLACTHNYVFTSVINQPTKDATGKALYTCSACGETEERDIAIPKAENFTVQNDLAVSSVVAHTFGFNYATNVTGKGYASYFVVVDYKYYGDGYVLNPDKKVFNPADASRDTGRAAFFTFSEMALSEMTLAYDVTIYMTDANGIVTGYNTQKTSIADVALAYAQKYSTNTKLLTCLADMMQYGTELQTFFAKDNPGTAIVDAKLPSEVLGSYMSNKSDASTLPDSFNNEKLVNKKVSTTGFNASGTLVIGASNLISYDLVRPDAYDLSKVQMTVSYVDSVLNEDAGGTIDLSKCSVRRNKANTADIYTYIFDGLAIYDANKVVTVSMSYNGVEECVFTYSLGNFVNTYIGQAKFTNVLSALELFANSTALQLNQPALW